MKINAVWLTRQTQAIDTKYVKQNNCTVMHK